MQYNCISTEKTPHSIPAFLAFRNRAARFGLQRWWMVPRLSDVRQDQNEQVFFVFDMRKTKYNPKNHNEGKQSRKNHNTADYATATSQLDTQQVVDATTVTLAMIRLQSNLCETQLQSNLCAPRNNF